jgi:hypothetical protein
LEGKRPEHGSVEPRKGNGDIGVLETWSYAKWLKAAG